MRNAPEKEDEILATLTPSPGRRWFGIASMALLGAILIWVAAVPQPALFWQIAFMIGGLGAIVGAYRMYVVTDDTVILTRDVLATTSGDVLAQVSNVRGVERGAFAFKPSNGFLVRLKQADGAPAWRPGLWWRRGTFLGIGGVVPGGQSRAMAEILTALILDMLPQDDPQ